MVIKVKIRTQRFKASSDYLIEKAEHFNFYVSYSRKGALKIERHKTKVKKKNYQCISCNPTHSGLLNTFSNNM